MNRWNSLRAALGVGVVLAACSAPPGVSTDQPPPDETATVTASPDTRPGVTRPSIETGEPMPSGLTGAVPEALLTEILADAAERAGVPVEQLEVVTASEVTFNDGSLGCPQPGMMYTQALVDGYHVVVRTPDGDLDYRASGRGGFRLCEHPVGP
jgi:hypothetical protein